MLLAGFPSLLVARVQLHRGIYLRVLDDIKWVKKVVEHLFILPTGTLLWISTSRVVSRHIFCQSNWWFNKLPVSIWIIISLFKFLIVAVRHLGIILLQPANVHFLALSRSESRRNYSTHAFSLLLMTKFGICYNWKTRRILPLRHLFILCTLLQHKHWDSIF